jgi:hypothetical protein
VATERDAATGDGVAVKTPSSVAAAIESDAATGDGASVTVPRTTVGAGIVKDAAAGSGASVCGKSVDAQAVDDHGAPLHICPNPGP